MFAYVFDVTFEERKTVNGRSWFIHVKTYSWHVYINEMLLSHGTDTTLVIIGFDMVCKKKEVDVPIIIQTYSFGWKQSLYIYFECFSLNVFDEAPE